MAPQAAITAYNAARAPSLARQESQSAVRNTTLREAQKEGYVAPPSDTGGGFINKQIQSFGGKAAMNQQASAKNQQVTNDLARRDIGLPKDAPLTQETLDNLRQKLAAPYREVAKVSPTASKALEKLMETREQSKLAWKEYNGPNHPRAALNEAKAFDAQAEVLEKVISREAMKAGKPGLLNELRDARRSIAKVYDVDRALNVGTGDVSAHILGRAVDKGRPITGGLATAGKFAEAFPRLTVEGARNPAPDINALNPLWMSGLGLGGYAALGPYGAALGGIPMLKGPARSMLLSKPYQRGMLPSYDPAMTPAPTPQLLMQLGILNGGQ
jgi:hypothetical protein